MPAEPIAIVGIGCRFPGGADTPEEYWRVLCAAEPTTSEVPPERGWSLGELHDRAPQAAGRSVARQANFLRDVDAFDPAFFGLTPREAEAIDPQHRLVLEVAWEALERAAQAPDRLAGSRSSIFVGILSNDYLHLQFQADPTTLGPYTATGSIFSLAAGRLAYLLDLRSLSVSVDSACSSALLAVHHAVRALRSGDCDLALAGGVNLMLLPEGGVILSQMRALSPDGRSKTFSAAADGYGRAEGCGIVVLKRLSDARADGDTVLALIRGTAANQDGRGSGVTVPNRWAQEDVIRAALEDGAVAPHEVGYVEAHGTGTPLGDPIEVAALVSVLCDGRPPDRPLVIGSAKAVIGHAESAAGAAGLIKAVLCLSNGAIPRQPDDGPLNPHLGIDAAAASVPRARLAWPPSAGPRHAGVSAFGFSGTNVHVVLEDAPAPTVARPPRPERPAHVLALSAHDEHALGALARRFAAHLAGPETAPPADICHSAGAGRQHHAHRVAVCARDLAGLRSGLDAVIAGVPAAGTITGTASATPPPIAFLFAGQGGASVGMGRGLYETQPTFRAVVDELAAVAYDAHRLAVLDHLYPASRDRDGTPLVDTAVAQPALFVLEAALARLWRSWGIAPAAVLGHSVGEYAAAAEAGVLTWEAGLELTIRRGRLMGSVATGGGMLAVLAERDLALAAAAGHPSVELAVVNGPRETVLAGPDAALDEIAAQLEQRRVRTRRLQVSHAFHSAYMAPILDEFEAAVAGVALCDPVLPFVAGDSGRVATPGELTAARRWRRCVRAPVLFWPGVLTLLERGIRICLELGPGTTLTALGLAAHPDAVWRASLRAGRDDTDQLLETLAALYVHGAPVDWAGFDAPYPRLRRPLPTYPFQRRRLWLAGIGRERPSPRAAAGLLGRRVDSPLAAAQFEATLSRRQLPALDDTGGLVHVGLYIELLAQAAARLGAATTAIAELSVGHALLVAPGVERRVQTVVEPGLPDAARVQIASRGEDGWTVHAHALLTAGSGATATSRPPAEIASGLAQSSGAEFYARLRERRGIVLGPSVALVETLWTQEGMTLARLRAGDGGSQTALGFAPGVLDACAQLVYAGLPADDDALYLFSRLGRLEPGRAAHGRLWCLAQFAPATGEARHLTGDVRLLDDAGTTIASLHGLELRRTRIEVLDGLGLPATVDASAAADGALARAIRAASTDEAGSLLRDELAAQLAQALGMTPAEVPLDIPLTRLGIDSLMSVQVRNALLAQLGTTLPLDRLLDGASVAELAAELVPAVLSDAPTSGAEGVEHGVL